MLTTVCTCPYHRCIVESVRVGQGIDSSLRTLRAQVARSLREQLVDGRFRPGERLDETELATRFGISRGTLREAMRNLEQEGLLVGIAHRGTFVRKLSADEVLNIYDVRSSLEARAARTAAARLTDERLSLLNSRLDALRASRVDGSYRDQVAADIAFHEAICSVSGNEILLNLWRSIAGQITAAMITAGPINVRPLQQEVSHQELLAVIEKGDLREIEPVFDAHFRSSANALARVIATAPDAEEAERSQR